MNNLASEPELGSPSRGGAYAARAVRDGDYWVINGRKTWSTLSPALTYSTVLLGVEEADGSVVRGTFFVPMETPGVRIEETWDSLSMRATGSHDVIFENVRVPEDYRLGQMPGLPAANPGGWGLIGSAVHLGISTAARDFAVDFAKERKPEALGGKAHLVARNGPAPDRPDRNPVAAIAIGPLRHRIALGPTSRMARRAEPTTRVRQVHRHQQRDSNHRSSPPRGRFSRPSPPHPARALFSRRPRRSRQRPNGRPRPHPHRQIRPRRYVVDQSTRRLIVLSSCQFATWVPCTPPRTESGRATRTLPSSTDRFRRLRTPGGCMAFRTAAPHRVP